MPSHNLALAYVISIFPLTSQKMSRILNGLILLQLSLGIGFCQQDLIVGSPIVPLLKTEAIEVHEIAGEGEGEAHFRVTLPERLRERHIRMQVDRSVCTGKVTINGEVTERENLDDVFRFDRSNHLILTACLERKGEVLKLMAYPKVFIERAQAKLDARKSVVEVEVTVRNALLNSVSCSVTILDHNEDFYVGPETSQTRSFFVRLKGKREDTLTLELYKYPESMEGAYRQIQSLIPTRIQP